MIIKNMFSDVFFIIFFFVFIWYMKFMFELLVFLFLDDLYNLDIYEDGCMI